MDNIWFYICCGILAIPVVSIIGYFLWKKYHWSAEDILQNEG